MKLDVRRVTKRYGETRALDGLTLPVGSARVLVLIGPSGGGKSTLLRVLGGLESADDGTVEINGHALPADPLALQHYRRRNGFLFQQFNLFPHLTARRNIVLPLEKVHGHPPAEALAIAEQALERFGLLEHAGKLPAQLSGGQQQRVGIARAVAHQPEVLFLDEPTSGLDPITARAFDKLVRSLVDDLGLTVFLITHDLDTLLGVVDRLIVLGGGHVLADGTVEAVMDVDDAWIREYFSVRRIAR